MLVDRIVSLTRWLLMAGIAYTLLGSLSYFLGPLPASSATMLAGAAPATGVESRRATLELIQSRHLFGIVQAGDAAAPAAPEPEAVATSLPLELRGVFVSDAPAASVAILALRNHRADLYSVGDTVPGDVELVAVHPDHVVLNNAGRNEILRFPKRTEASRRSPGVLGADASMVEIDYSYQPVQRVEDHPDRYEPGFSAVLGRIVTPEERGG